MRVFRNPKQSYDLCVRVGHREAYDLKAVAVIGPCKRVVPCSDGDPVICGQINIRLLHIIQIHAVLARANRSELGLVCDLIIGFALQFDGLHLR